MYLAQTKDYKLRLKATQGEPTLRLFTDASFAQEGKHSFGGHILEFKGAPVVWRAGRQQLISMSSAECELIQVVEGSTYAESFQALLKDLEVASKEVRIGVDNTAAISLVRGGGSQRTRHLKVRAAKLNPLLQEGWILEHCQGLYQKADILTKLLPSARLKFLCDLLGLGPNETGPRPKVQKVQGASKVSKVCLVGLLTSLQGVVCKGQEEKPAIEVEWPYELLIAMVLVILSTVCLWESIKSGCSKGGGKEPQQVPRIRAIAAAKERKAKKLQERVTAAIDSIVSETSPSGSEPMRVRKGRNKCPPDTSAGAAAVTSPVIQAGIVHVHSPADPRVDADQAFWDHYRDAPASSTMPPLYGLPDPHLPTPPPPKAYAIPSPPLAHPVVRVLGEGSRGGGLRAREEGIPTQSRKVSQTTQTEPVIVLSADSSVFMSQGGHCIHCEIGCRGLRNAGHIQSKTVCQYCLRKAGPRSGF